ncbi:MAG: polyprenyl synthetase [Deltaproteobacteria bacterium]|nr:MAG: polyprenyl synthetase [Deltaproteobacteria bacterium]
MSRIKEIILSRAKTDLSDINQALEANLTPYHTLAKLITEHILFAGGKRMRPLLMVLTARACGYRGTDAASLSTMFEYLHAATLLHDDLVDQADVRRNRPAAHLIWGNSEAVLSGDYLLAKALSLAAKTDNLRIIKVIAAITEDMSQGELHQLANRGRVDLTEAEYLDVIRRKTAVLLEAACRTGAILADMPEQVETACATYGHHLGMAFQMADDLLDYTADPNQLGKAVGTDLAEGKVTLPVIHSLHQAIIAGDAAAVTTIESTLGAPDITAELFSVFVSYLNQYGGIDYTRNQAKDQVAAAKSALQVLPESSASDLLRLLADYSLDRES